MGSLGVPGESPRKRSEKRLLLRIWRLLGRG